MGKSARERPKRLAEKLLQIRTVLGLSQNQMLARLRLDERLSRTAISGYELGTTEPSLPVLFRYAKVAGVCLDVLVDDDADLPEKLPSKPKHKK